MNERKLQKLFDSARREPAPEPSPGFDARVLSALRREQPPESVFLLDQLGQLYPRLAWAAALVIALCVAADYGLAAWGVPDLAAGTALLSDQWLFTQNGF